MKINRKQLIKKYLDFFKSKDHKEIPNSSLVPENDPTVLFTTAGMHPLVPFLLGEKHPQGKRLTNVQKCIRTQDIDEVGDTCHHTFFEMLGNWSLGDYFKKEAIEFSFEFLTKKLNLPLDKLAVSVFAGDKDASKDNESAKTWEALGIPKSRIAFLPKINNWWGPAGQTGPCGPDTEMFYWKPNNKPAPEIFNPNDSNWVEIWNDVLMQYNKDKKGNYNEASQKNIDTGMGVERTIASLNNLEDNYLTDCWQPIIQKIEILAEEKYAEDKKKTKAMRIIADHIKAAVFILADGIVPGNTEQGYVLRRLIRRAIRYGRELGIERFTSKIAEPIFFIYDDYSQLKQNQKQIFQELEKEEDNFLKTLEQGIRVFEKLATNTKQVTGKDAFLLYQSYGFPIEMTKELADEKNIKINEKEFQQEEEKHKQLSKTAAQGRFKSGLADNSEQTTKLHTAAHLLNQALREVLNNQDIHQKGSNITPERIRFDFNFDRKLTNEELKQIQDWVNDKIKKQLNIEMNEMTLEQAKQQEAQGVFDTKYKDKVKVYTIKEGNKIISNEICAGPHMDNTKELGRFKIIKEESSSSGVRRIKAVLE